MLGKLAHLLVTERIELPTNLKNQHSLHDSVSLSAPKHFFDKGKRTEVFKHIDFSLFYETVSLVVGEIRSKSVARRKINFKS